MTGIAVVETLLRVVTSPFRTLGLAIVRGRSMLPTLMEGQRLLVLYGRDPRPGEVVIARLRDGTLVIKRAIERRPSGWWLLSDNPAEGLGDSRAWGAVLEIDVLAVAVWKLWPRFGRLAPASTPRR